MRKKIDDHAELQALDVHALASIVGGDADADRDLITELGAAQPADLELCKSELQGKMGHLSLHSVAECMRGAEKGARWNARDFANRLQ